MNCQFCLVEIGPTMAQTTPPHLPECPNRRMIIAWERPPVPPDTKYQDSNGVTRYATVMTCTCGTQLWHVEGVRAHWQMGHFDSPVYATRAEIIAARSGAS